MQITSRQNHVQCLHWFLKRRLTINEMFIYALTFIRSRLPMLRPLLHCKQINRKIVFYLIA